MQYFSVKLLPPHRILLYVYHGAKSHTFSIKMNGGFRTNLIFRGPKVSPLLAAGLYATVKPVASTSVMFQFDPELFKNVDCPY